MFILDIFLSLQPNAVLLDSLRQELFTLEQETQDKTFELTTKEERIKQHKDIKEERIQLFQTQSQTFRSILRNFMEREEREEEEDRVERARERARELRIRHRRVRDDFQTTKQTLIDMNKQTREAQLKTRQLRGEKQQIEQQGVALHQQICKLQREIVEMGRVGKGRERRFQSGKSLMNHLRHF